ncbi:MAG: membrane dipeptidase [Congregibacter sp.]
MPNTPPLVSDPAVELLRESLIWDNHGCMPLRPGDHGFLPQLSRYRQSGVDVISLNIGFGSLSVEQHLRQLADFRLWVSQSDDFLLADSLVAIQRAREAGKLAVFFDIEGMAILDQGDAGLISMFRELGVGWMLVAYNEANSVGGGCRDADDGLTVFGKDVLREMKRVGMIVCWSHTGHRTAREVIETADNPVIFSHSNPSGLYPHYRNIPDDLIVAAAGVGGVVGINGVGEFLGPGEDYAALLAKHIDYVVQLVGPEHVGLGLDYVFDQRELIEYINSMPDTFGEAPDHDALLRFAPPEIFPRLIQRLFELGYPAGAIKGILGENWQRVASEVWH